MKLELTDDQAQCIAQALIAMPLAMNDPRDPLRRNLVARILAAAAAAASPVAPLPPPAAARGSTGPNPEPQDPPP